MASSTSISPGKSRPWDQRSAFGASVALAASLRRTCHWDHSPGVPRSSDRLQRSLSPSDAVFLFRVLSRSQNALVARQGRAESSARAANDAGTRRCHSASGRPASPVRASRRLTFAPRPIAGFSRNAYITILVPLKDLGFVLALEPHSRLEERNQTRAHPFLLLRTLEAKPRWARLYGQFPGVWSLRQPQSRCSLYLRPLPDRRPERLPQVPQAARGLPLRPRRRPDRSRHRRRHRRPGQTALRNEPNSQPKGAPVAENHAGKAA